MTTGTFDILHYGHINLLKQAKELGDYLIVGLNVSPTGKTPYYSYEDRKFILESIKYVDEVVPIYKQEDKFNYLGDVDLFVTSEEYKDYYDIKDIQKYCTVTFLPRTPSISTTKIKSDNMQYKTFVIDIDDTICFTENRDFENSKPYQEVIDRINQLHDEGWCIILATARGQKSCKTITEMYEKYYDVTKRWMDKHGVKYDAIIFGKPNADYYVDDKNMSIDEFIKRRKI